MAIRYYNNTLTVKTDIDGTGNWDDCFVAEGVHLPTGLYLGVTAATGDLSDNHDVVSIKTYMLETLPEQQAKLHELASLVPSASHAAPHRDHVEDVPPPTSWKRFFFILFIILIVLVVGGIGFYVYNEKSKESRRKRFY